MSVGTQKSPISLAAGEALEAHRVVRLHASTAATVVYADSGERAVGVVPVDVASGSKAPVELLHGGTTIKVVAAGAISANAEVYTANDGKVSASVSGEPLGRVLVATSNDGDFTILLPYGQSGGDNDKDWAVFEDDFLWPNIDESGSEGVWSTDVSDGGAVTMQDAHGGQVALSTSDTTVADNDEAYLATTNEIYKPAIGVVNGEVLAILKGRLKLTEANTNDANIIFGLLGGDNLTLDDTLTDNGAGPADANQYIAMWKVDGGAVWQGGVRDTAQDHDTNVGAFSDGAFAELKMVIYDADIADGELEVEFFVDGVSGGTKTYAVSGATEMRIIAGVKNGGANEETLYIDKVRFEFKR